MSHEHAYGEGYYDLVNKVRVKRTQICKVCGERLVTDLTAEPAKPKTRTFRVQGLSGGERNINGY